MNGYTMTGIIMAALSGFFVMYGVHLDQKVRLPGIPPAGSPAADSFWTSFWSALYAGALYSIVTGLVVGLVVWWWQRSAEVRQTRTQFSREFAVASERLRATLDQPNPLIIESAVASMPPAATAAEAALKDSPVSVWAEYLPDERPTLDAIRRLQRANSHFRDSAAKLDFALRQFIRKFNAAKDIIAVNDPTNHSFCIGRIHGVAPLDLLPWIGFGTQPGALPELDESASAALNDAQVKQTIQPYVDARQEVIAALDTLKQLLVARLKH